MAKLVVMSEDGTITGVIEDANKRTETWLDYQELEPELSAALSKAYDIDMLSAKQVPSPVHFSAIRLESGGPFTNMLRNTPPFEQYTELMIHVEEEPGTGFEVHLNRHEMRLTVREGYKSASCKFSGLDKVSGIFDHITRLVTAWYDGKLRTLTRYPDMRGLVCGMVKDCSRFGDLAVEYRERVRGKHSG